MESVLSRAARRGDLFSAFDKVAAHQHAGCVSSPSDFIASMAARFRGLGVSVPGLLNSRSNQTVMSPNLHMLHGIRLADDLGQRTKMRCVVLHESHALSVGERLYGAARGMDDFVMLDVTTGLGLGIFSGGRLLTGNSGMAGEIGHITVEREGLLCGCGNRRCLETVATIPPLHRRFRGFLESRRESKKSSPPHLNFHRLG